MARSKAHHDRGQGHVRPDLGKPPGHADRHRAVPDPGARSRGPRERRPPPGFLPAYRDAFGADDRFALFIRGLSRLGGPNDPALAVFEREEGDREIGGLRDLARGLGLKLAETTGDDPVCYAARANSFLVRANGRLNKCTVALEHPSNQVGCIREDGTVEVTAPTVARWTRGLWSGSPEELRCPMHGLADDSAEAAPESEPVTGPGRAVRAG